MQAYPICREVLYTQSTLMTSLINLLDTPENKEKLKKLSLEKAFKELKDRQAEFEKVFKEQVDANARLRESKSASATRQDLERALRNYLGLVKAMQTKDGWKHLYHELNELAKGAKK